MSDDQVGLLIDGRLYEFPASYTLGEARAIKRITGLTLAAFAEQVRRDFTDPDVMTAVVYVAIHRSDPSVTVEQVEALDLSTIGGDGAAGEQEEGEKGDPPSSTAAAPAPAAAAPEPEPVTTSPPSAPASTPTPA